ncbi:phage regulatory CII family protein [Metapseudomonas otitidis]|uniref:phage regulatory CII family protein n=1 Tax=Metapseudomonas otitidis TaxID=319939 RepID=UPI0024AD951B|nr:phage regulatory CII family protein [Pseudomonas otitidis]MDI6527714.1 hypothetical protein [Pseudomonas otitidis]
MLTLAQALHHAVRDYPGGAAAIAAVDGGNATTLNHKLSLTPANSRHRVNIDDLQLILDLTRDQRIVDAILSPIGWVGVDVSELSETDTPRSLLAGISDMLSREGDLTKHLSNSLEDDNLSDRELQEFELLTIRLVQAVFKLRAVVRKKHREDSEVDHG